MRETCCRSAFQLCQEDNVATMLHDAEETEDVKIIGEPVHSVVRAIEQIHTSHKIALRPIGVGEAIVKYGFPIGEATRQIAKGEWVHLHNCRSHYDLRSSELDIQTGIRGETRYV